MKRVKVIPFANLPTRPPLTLTGLIYLLLDHFKAPGWVQGAVYTVLALLWIVCIFAMFGQDYKTPKFED